MMTAAPTSDILRAALIDVAAHADGVSRDYSAFIRAVTARLEVMRTAAEAGENVMTMIADMLGELYKLQGK